MMTCELHRVASDAELSGLIGNHSGRRRGGVLVGHSQHVAIRMYSFARFIGAQIDR